MMVLLLLAAVGSLPPMARGADLVWSESDWSGGRYESTAGVDPEIHPGLLVLENRIDDFRFLAEPSTQQGLWSMEAYHDTLFITASPYPYGLPGADVLAYDYPSNTFEIVYQPNEHGLHLIKAFGDTLYLPGPDTRDIYFLAGSIYTYDGDEWRELEEFARSIHVNDVEVVHGRIYVSTGQATGFMEGHGCVWVSDDWGQSFSVAFSIAPTPEDMFRRIFGLGHIGNRLFAEPDGDPPETNMIFTTLDGVDWDTTTVNGLPVERQSVYVPWSQDSLLMGCDNRLYIWTGTQWRSRTMPFNLSRWGRGLHIYEGELYGGGQSCELYRWIRDSQWELVTTLPLDPTEQSVGALETHFGRLFLCSWGASGYVGQLLVSAAEPLGTLVSLPHDFGTRTRNGFLYWDDVCPAATSSVAFQLRSAVAEEELAGRPFLGPDGTGDTWFEETGMALPGQHQGRRFFQYRVELRCPDELWMPFVRSMTLEVDSLDAGTVEEPAPGDGAGHGIGPASGLPAPRLVFAAPLPNPSRTSVLLSLTLLPDRLGRVAAGSAATAVLLEVVDSQGRRVRSITAPIGEAGRMRWDWDLRDTDGRRVAAGVYQVTATLSDGRATGRSRTLVVVP